MNRVAGNNMTVFILSLVTLQFMEEHSRNKKSKNSDDSHSSAKLQQQNSVGIVS